MQTGWIQTRKIDVSVAGDWLAGMRRMRMTTAELAWMEPVSCSTECAREAEKTTRPPGWRQIVGQLLE
ncbi:hypothetical protein E2562_027573 [Oryza meyeriana var. granulata]|uniref:Uncharacterized protein n=1 Tax=Oryza meyeriana var. granulata TaxID=110450 RepID=A0A6G1DNR7_9ORYZ|nr:hypothetical protein E2562_027573 [Oryza meyeriana var. granulata]